MGKKKCIFVLDDFFFSSSSFPELNVWCIYRIQGEYLRVASNRAAFWGHQKAQNHAGKGWREGGAGERRPRAHMPETFLAPRSDDVKSRPLIESQMEWWDQTMG